MKRISERAQRFVTQHSGAIIAVFLFGLTTWWIYPFADVSRNPAFNSDSAVVLSMATQKVPIEQSIFYWGTARSGSLLVAVGRVVGAFVSEQQLLQFFSLGAACFAALACTIIVGSHGGQSRNANVALLPAGIFLLGANFATPPSFISLSWLMTDIASRPELPCLLVAMSWLAVRLGDRRSTCIGRQWNCLFIGYLLVASTAAWISDFSLVAALIIAIVLVVLAALRRDRLPWELFLGVLVSGISLYLLRHISPYGATQTKSLLRLVNGDSFRALLGPAVVNIAHQLTWSTWIAIAVLVVTFALWSLVHHTTAAVWSAKPACLQCFLLAILGISEIATALANQWVYDNGVFPRYFTPGVVLLCLAATQSAVFLMSESRRSGPANKGLVFACFVGLILLLPPVLSAYDGFVMRRNLLRVPHSVQYASSDALYRAGARAVVGPYWKAYVNVVAHPVRLKATPRDGDEDRSAANTINCLRARRIAFVEDDSSALLPLVAVRGFDLRAISSAPAEKLPDGSFYKLYRNSGRLTIDARNPPTLLYLDERWHFGERDAAGAWVWASSNSAGLNIPLSPRTTYKVQIDAFTFRAQNGRAQAAVLRLDGQFIATLRFDENGILLTPEAQFVTGTGDRSHFEIVSDLALPESAVNQNTANERILAIAIRRLSFEPLQSSSS